VRQLEIKVMNIIDARCNHEVYEAWCIRIKNKLLVSLPYVRVLVTLKIRGWGIHCTETPV